VLARSKVKVREWSNLGRERLLGAAIGDGGGGQREEFTGSKSGPVKGKSALRVARKLSLLRQDSRRSSESEGEVEESKTAPLKSEGCGTAAVSLPHPPTL
jgi:hypothetical protein